MRSKNKNKPKEIEKKHLKYLDPINWQLPTIDELKDYYESFPRSKDCISTLLFQKHLSSVDVYTFLKACFGKPNGFMNSIKSPTSDNLIHWDYLLKNDDVLINILGLHRDVQITISKKLNATHWKRMVENFRNAFATLAKEKSKEKNKLEVWTVFINRYAELCSEAEIYHEKVDLLKDSEFKISDILSEEDNADKRKDEYERQINDFQNLQQSCLALKLLTPIILESFINLILLVTCKKEVRENKIIYDAKIKEHLNTKILSLHLNCNYFAKPIGENSTEYKNFRKIMNSRNWFFHGNTDPQKDKIETVYFENTTPFYQTPGNVHQKYFESLKNMIKPEEILKSYEQSHEFITYVMNCIDAKFRDNLWQMIETNSIGYNIKEDRYGVLFNDFLVSSQGGGIKNDEELFEFKGSA